MLTRARLWLRSILFRGRLEREMQEEMAIHLDRSIARLVERGLSAEDARFAALREFGNVGHLQERARDARGARWVEALAGDVRFALRHFARTPGTTVTMFVVLVGGLIISTLLFTYAYAYANNPPPGVRLEADLVRIRGILVAADGDRVYRHFSEEELLEYRKLHGQFASVAGWTDASVVLELPDDAERRTQEARVSFVTESYFPVLGVRTAVGPGLPAAVSDDPERGMMAVIGHTAWVELFGMNPGAVGSTLIVNGHPITVVGVAPREFTGFPGFSRFQLWMPLSARRSVLRDLSGGFRAVARLRDGVTLAAASQATDAIATRVGESDPRFATVDPSADVVQLLSANSDPMFERDIRLLWLTVGFLGLLVLLIACTNTSALLTGLATSRRQEIAVRLSLGAARARLIRQLLTESALLATGAGAASLSLVWLVLRAVSRLIPGMPFEVGVTWPVLAFTFGIALAVGVLFGLSPALHATRLALASVLRDSAGTVAAARGRLQRSLVVAQIAFTQPLIVLLVAVLLFLLRDFQPLLHTDYADQVVSVSIRRTTPVSGPGITSEDVEAQMRAALERLRVRIETTPGVRAVTLTSWFGWDARPYIVHADDVIGGSARGAVELTALTAGERYLEVMGIPLVRGRPFEPGDVGTEQSRRAHTPVLIGSELARRLWGGADPIGRRLETAVDTAVISRMLVVVGVVDDPRARSRRKADAHVIYIPPRPGANTGSLMIRTAGAGNSLIPVFREIARTEAPDMNVGFRTLGDIQDENTRRFRMITSGIGVAGIIALLLSAIGLYAVVAFAVVQRTREIAVRMAVGALGRQIIRRFVGDGLRLSAIGLVMGLPASVLGLRLLMDAVPDIPPVALSSVTLVAAAGVIIVAGLAAWLPARRAAAIDPAVTLRHE